MQEIFYECILIIMVAAKCIKCIKLKVFACNNEYFRDVESLKIFIKWI